MHALNRVALAGMAACLVGGPVYAQTCYSELIAFGDSLTDTGNLQSILGLPLPPYAAGRLSNGPVWLDGLADNLGLSSLNSASGGGNYAWAGARTGPAGAVFPPLSLLDQANTYLSNVSGIADAEALYVLWGGANDVRDNDAQNAVPDIAAIIADLAFAGARNFLVLNLPDLGKTPESLNGMAPGGTAAQITAASLSYNSALAAALSGLSATLTDVTIMQLDVFTRFNALLSNSAGFGFINVTDPCWNGNYFGIGMQCELSSTYLFWDAIHPTAAGHAIVANDAFDLIVSESPVDTDGDCDPDISDPDDDNDGIGDALDTQPLIANNFCSGGADAYIFSEMVVEDLACAAATSITVVPPAEVMGTGKLQLIAPAVSFEPGFSATGPLTVISAEPCPGCAP